MHESTATSLLTNLKQHWGYPGFRPLQREAMSLVMSDRDSLVVLPTGGGKSLCYQVPAISRDGMAIIVSPLISLMKDQVDSLHSVGVSAACINSMQTAQNKRDVAGQIRRHELKLLYIAPERLLQPQTIEFLQGAGVSFIAIDEAHCISQWGHDFRPEYRQLRCLKTAFPGAAVHGYTTSDSLNRLGFKTLPYHAGMSDEGRRKNQDAFIDEDVNIIVATVAFGMGIDKSNVRFVIHAEMPRSLENYQQESGRAGRDGLEAECCLLYAAKDADTWEYLMKDTEDPAVRQTGQRAVSAMQQYCVSTRCRHQQLVEHFGQTLQHENCGACDFCLNEMQPVEDPSILGQKLLSCVVRQGERFGAAYTTQVLRGSKGKRIIENGHDKLSTWGLLKDEPEPQVRNWFDQLLSQGFLRQVGEYNCLEVTPLGRQLLKGQATPMLLRMQVADSAQPVEDQWEGVDRNLFDELRGMRNRLAVQKQVPPYIIFSDATLRDLARQRPSNVGVLTRIHGIGTQKQKEFGAVVLHTIKEWCHAHNVAMNIETPSPVLARSAGKSRSSQPRESTSGEYYDLFEQGLSLEDVANQLDRALDTVSKYLGEYLKAHQISDIDAWITPKLQKLVQQAISKVGCERLKPIFEHLESQVDYARIRIVVIAWEIEQSNVADDE